MTGRVHTFLNDGEDQVLATGLLDAIGGQLPAGVVSHPGSPIPKARARVGKRGSYTPIRTKSAQDSLARLLRYTMPRQQSNAAVACIFYRDDHRAVDVDNLLKLVMDAATAGLVWRDDSQVTAAVGVIELDRQNPRTIIAIGSHTSSLPRHIVRVK